MSSVIFSFSVLEKEPKIESKFRAGNFQDKIQYVLYFDLISYD